MLKTFIVKLLVFINLAEGLIHLVVSMISLWGIWDIGIWDWRILTAPAVDLFLGLASLFTSYILKDMVGCCKEGHKTYKGFGNIKIPFFRFIIFWTWFCITYYVLNVFYFCYEECSYALYKLKKLFK